MTELETGNAHQHHKDKVVAQEFDYKTWAKKTANYIEVDITEDMHPMAKTTLPIFRWRYCIIGKDLDLFDNTDLTPTPKD